MKMNRSKKHSTVFLVLVISAAVIILVAFLYQQIYPIMLVPSLLNANYMKSSYYADTDGFNEIVELLKTEGNCNFDNHKDYYLALLLCINNKEHHDVSMEIQAYDECVQDLSDKLTESVIHTMRDHFIVEVSTRMSYFWTEDKSVKVAPADRNLRIIFQFDAKDDAYLVYYEGEPDHQLISPTENVWETMPLEGNWYVCYELDEINTAC